MFRKLFIFFSSFLENEGPLSSSKANKVKTNKYGESALHVAIKKGDYEKAKSLIDESDADVNMKDNAGEFSVQWTFHILCNHVLDFFWPTYLLFRHAV